MCWWDMAELVMTVEHSVVGSQLVVHELDGVASFDGDGAGLESQHSGIGAKLHFNSGGVGRSDADGADHEKCDDCRENGLQALKHDVRNTWPILSVFRHHLDGVSPSLEAQLQDLQHGCCRRSARAG